VEALSETCVDTVQPWIAAAVVAAALLLFAPRPIRYVLWIGLAYGTYRYFSDDLGPLAQFLSDLLSDIRGLIP